MTAPSVFISYSHKDEEWKDRLVTHLGVLEKEGLLDLWDDRKIEVGVDWRPEIEKAIERADIAILLISANFLTSNFILDEEVPKFLARREKKGMRVFPLIVKPCAWTEVKWLSKIQARPTDGKPLSTRRAPQADSDLAAFAKEIAGIVRRSETREVSETSRVWRIPPDKISLAKLPSTDPTLFGRDDRLKELNAAWENPKINIVSLVAWGGVGKTALMKKWLSQMAGDNYCGAERVFGWSFYSQGAKEGAQNSADQFIANALEWFGDDDPTKGSPWDKGIRLAEFIRAQRTLLILDGLEPLQSPSTFELGKIKDPGLSSLLRELALHNPGLVVITTRLTVDDFKDCVGETVIETELESLSKEDGAAYLKHLGVDGTDEERQQTSHDFGGHALALTLLGRYLKVVHNGDIRKRGEIPHVMDEQKQGAHARRVMESYERWLQGKPELDILRLMGLFDRPAEKGALDALRKEPAIPGLTDSLQKLSDAQWKYAVNDLRELRLLAPEDPHAPDELDCHPLLREHFGEKLKAENINAWQEAHGRLYEYYKNSVKEFPETLEEMAPLFAAVMHGCQAWRHKEAFGEIYWKRIARGEEYFATKKLGAFSTELSMISGFFDSQWSKPVTGLHENTEVVVLMIAGFDLQALGRLPEAAQPMQAALKNAIDEKHWKNAAIQASNLSGLTLTIGDVTQALAYAEQSLQLADKSGDEFQRWGKRTTLGETLHQAGNLAKSQRILREAEEIQKKDQLEFPLLYGLAGFRYCDLLLSQGDYAEVERRASQTLELARQYLGLLDVALDNLSLGRAQLLHFQRTPNLPITNYQSLTHLHRAVDSLRQLGAQEFIVRGLLARAEYYRVTGDLVKAQKDVDEAFTIATRGGMGLHLADCHLEFARLNVARGRGEPMGRPYLDKAREHLTTAKEMINHMGYHRRDKEVQELEKELGENL